MHDPLFLPSPERIVATNAWAFLLRLAPEAALAARPPGATWAALRAAIAADPVAARAALAGFAPTRAPAGSDPDRHLMDCARLLLHFDLRPDDVVLLAGTPTAPWQAAGQHGTRVLGAETTPDRLLDVAAATGVSVLVAPAGWIAAAAFPRRPRLTLQALRQVICLGGPMSGVARARVYAWVKPDAMLLAAAGARVWGNPVSAVLAAPPAEPALFGPAASRSAG